MTDFPYSARNWFGRQIAAGLTFALLAAVPLIGSTASAQSDTQWDSLYDRIIRLEHRLNSVEQGGTTQATQEFGADPATNASLSLRIDQVEAELRTLLGQVQELNFRVRELTDQIRRSSEDTEFRFQQLETAVRDGRQGNASPSTGTSNQQAADAQPGANDYGDLSAFDQYPSAQGGATPLDLSSVQSGTGEVAVNQAPGTQVLGTLPLSELQPSDTTVASVPDAVVTQPLDGSTGSSAAQSLYESSYNDMLRRRFSEAEQGFLRFLQDYGTHELAPNAQYWLGETHYARGDFRQAASAFLTGYRDYNSSVKAPDSLLKLGMSLRNLGERDQACATFTQVVSQYPDAPQSILDLADREQRRAGC